MRRFVLLGLSFTLLIWICGCGSNPTPVQKDKTIFNRMPRPDKDGKDPNSKTP